GGAKVSDKITVIERLVGVADRLVVGGAMANTFLKYKGYNVGASKVETGQNKVLDAIYTAAHHKSDGHADDFIMLPADVAVAKSISDKAERRNAKLDGVAKDEKILDIGAEAIENVIQA